jgi:hypothetical protein
MLINTLLVERSITQHQLLEQFNLWGSDSPKLASLAPRMLLSLA